MSRYYRSLIQPLGGGAYNFEQALEFDGVNDFCSMPALTSSVEFTLSLWFKTNNFAGCFIGSSTNFQGIRLLSSTSIQVAFGNSQVFTVPEMSTGVWYNLVIDNTNLNPFGLLLSLNGVPSSTGRIVRTQNWSNADQLGKIQSGSSRFNGVMDDLLVWNDIAASSQQITDLYNGGAGVDPTTVIPNPNRWYKFNGNPNDSGSDAQNLTLNNFSANPYVNH